MPWDEVVRLKTWADEHPDWRLMDIQQRSAGEWVCIMWRRRDKQRAEVTLADNFIAAVAEGEATR